MSIEKQKTEFIHYCLYEKNLSPKTLKAYEIDIRQFILFLTDNQYSKDTVEIDKQIIRHYLRTISLAKPKTIKRKVATLKAMFNYLEYEDRISVSPFRKMRIQIKEPKNLPNVMNVGEIEAIIKALYRAKAPHPKDSHAYAESVRNIAVVELLFAMGVRVSELSHLKTECINLKTGIVKVRGKGNKERIIQICNEETIHALVEYQNSSISKANQTSYFFINRLGKRLSEQSIRFLIACFIQIVSITLR